MNTAMVLLRPVYNSGASHSPGDIQQSRNHQCRCWRQRIQYHSPGSPPPNCTKVVCVCSVVHQFDPFCIWDLLTVHTVSFTSIPHHSPGVCSFASHEIDRPVLLAQCNLVKDVTVEIQDADFWMFAVQVGSAEARRKSFWRWPKLMVFVTQTHKSFLYLWIMHIYIHIVSYSYIRIHIVFWWIDIVFLDYPQCAWCIRCMWHQSLSYRWLEKMAKLFAKTPRWSGPTCFLHVFSRSKENSPKNTDQKILCALDSMAYGFVLFAVCGV